MAKILIVEDDKALLATVCDYLRAERHVVEGTCDGDDALALLKTYPYDLLVLDLNIPGLPGLDVCRYFRDSGGTAPILMLTGKDRVQEKVEGFTAGCDDYLTKPFDMRELGVRVQALLRRPQQLMSEQLCAGRISLDLQKRECFADGKQVQLAPQEFALLEFLIKHPNIAFSPEALLDRVWKSSAEVTENTVRTCIYRVKSRLNLAEGNPRIKNAHGVGYIFEVL